MKDCIYLRSRISSEHGRKISRVQRGVTLSDELVRSTPLCRARTFPLQELPNFHGRISHPCAKCLVLQAPPVSYLLLLLTLPVWWSEGSYPYIGHQAIKIWSLSNLSLLFCDFDQLLCQSNRYCIACQLR